MLGFDIDTIKLFLSWQHLRKYDFVYLEQLINPTKVKRGYYKNWYQGNLKGFNITFHPDKGIKIIGSLSNYYSGYKLVTGYDDLLPAVIKLEKELKLDLKNSTLQRIDLGVNIITSQPIANYTHHLFIDLPKFKRLEQNDGVRFETKSIVFAIYNKTAQLKEQRNIESQNLLRLEFRILKNLSRFFKHPIQLKHLLDLSTYSQIVELFYNYYNKIKKQTISHNRILSDLNPKKFRDFVWQKGIEQMGGEKEAYRFIEQADKESKFKNAIDKSRCRGLVRDFCNSSILELHPLVVEINSKINIIYSNG
jgi:hypothetical protein